MLEETAYGTIINKTMEKDVFKINNKGISGFGAFIFDFKHILGARKTITSVIDFNPI